MEGKEMTKDDDLICGGKNRFTIEKKGNVFEAPITAGCCALG
jgi:hypothetical protein